MLKKTLLLCLLLQSLYTLAQQTDVDWFPVGARWEYRQTSLYGSLPNCTLEVTEKIQVDGKTCSVLFSDGCLLPHGDTTAILCPEGDKVYWYVEDDFRLLYDFAAEVGDTIRMWVPWEGGYDDTTHLEVVNTVSSVQLGNKTYRSYSSNFLDIQGDFWFIGDFPIVEKIGSIYFLLPQNQRVEREAFGLIQYTDPCYTITLDCQRLGEVRCDYEVEIAPPCDTMVQIKSFKATPNLQLYPVPADEMIVIENPSNQIVQYQIYTISGQRMARGTVQGNSQGHIFTESFPDGLYVLTTSSNQRVRYQKFIVHH